MSNVKKLMMTAAGAGGGLNVEDVFSNYVYQGDQATSRTITNDIDLSGEGGMVWFKNRYDLVQHILFDTERGVNKSLRPDSTNAETTYTNVLTAFNSDGFTIGNSGTVNDLNDLISSWTFRKAPKFFDVVTYNGNSSTNVISHNLGSTPGCMIIKCTSSSAPSGTTSQWMVYHRGLSSPTTQALYLNGTAQAQGYGTGLFGVSDTTFTLNNTNETNDAGNSYVAYLFAHNDGDGEFGPNADQDIIKCGSYTGNGSGNGPQVDLGFEPQWIMIKEATTVVGNGSWFLADSIRGANEQTYRYLRANSYGSENLLTNPYITINSTGFKINQNDNTLNEENQKYIYMAVRRGPMAVPTDANDVFAIDTHDTTQYPKGANSGFPIDFMISTYSNLSQNNWVHTRLSPASLETHSSDSEVTAHSQYVGFDHSEGVEMINFYGGTNANIYYFMWRCAPNFLDVVSYTGDGTIRNINHKLGVAPEMMWIKGRNLSTDWTVYYGDYQRHLNLNTSDGGNGTGNWDNTHPTDTVFTVNSTSEVGQNNGRYLAYLFASLDGISKVGTYTGNGSSQTIDCGFSSGARFVIIKRTDAAGSWNVFDTERGIVAGNDPIIYLDSQSVLTGYDSIDPHNSGFIINQLSNTYLNASGASYLFYAIA